MTLLISKDAWAAPQMGQIMGNLRRDYLVSVPLRDEDRFLPVYLFRRKDSADEAVLAFFDAV